MNANFQPPARVERIDRAGRSLARNVVPIAGPRRAVPSISGLIAFEATARHLSFSDAAHELALTQGAVSKRVRQLESVLGITLLARTRRKVVLTEPGQRYLIDVRRLLGEIQAATTSLQAGAKRPTITLAAPPEITSYWLMPRLGEFQALHPDLSVNLVCWKPMEDRAQAIAPECAIRCVDETMTALSGHKMFAEHLVPVAAPQFLVAHDLSTPAALMKAPLILQNGRHAIWQDWFQALDIHPGEPLEGNSHDCMSLVIQAALNGHGVALAPVHVVRDLIDDDRLRIVFDVPFATDRSYVFSADPAFAWQKPVRQFQDWMSETVRAMA